MLARDYKWTPDQVNALDPDFLLELQMEQAARSDVQLFGISEPDTATKAQQLRRKVEIMKWREAARGG